MGFFSRNLVKSCYNDTMKTLSAAITLNLFFRSVISISFLLLPALSFANKIVDMSGTQYCENKSMHGVEVENSDLVNVDRIVVQKSSRLLYLMSNGKIVKSYAIAMGPNSEKGPKEFEGDNKTPEGLYSIEFKNPKSNYYMALKVSYPNDQDLAYAKAQGKKAGGFIMVHGFPVRPIDGLIPSEVKDMHPAVYWTQGCMAVTDREIEEIYSYIQVKTPIEICPR